MSISGIVGHALAGKGEGTSAVDIVVTGLDEATLVSPAGDRCIPIRINSDAADSIDEADDEAEIDANVVINLDAEELLCGGLAELDSAERAGMSHFVIEAARSAGDVNLIVARNSKEKNVGSLRINSNHHIDIRAGGIGHIIFTSVDTGEIN